MADNKQKAQAFMNENKLKECFECDDVFFKHKENATARAVSSGKEVINHSVNAGGKTKKETSAASE